MFILLSHLINVLSNVYGQLGPIIGREVVCKLEKESHSLDLSANHLSRHSSLWDFCEQSNIEKRYFEKWKNQCSSITAWEEAAVVEVDSIGWRLLTLDEIELWRSTSLKFLIWAWCKMYIMLYLPLSVILSSWQAPSNSEGYTVGVKILSC